MAQSETRTVRLKVPKSQLELWDEDADEFDMPRTEFIRQMVQAGRREFGLQDNAPESTEPSSSLNPSAETPDDLESRVETQLDETPTPFDEIVGAITGDIEREVGNILQDASYASYDPVDGGYYHE